MITQTHAWEIARKLSASIRRGRKHDIAEINHEGKRVGQFGIRRGSRDQSHSYVPKQLYISLAQTEDLAACPMSAEKYFKVLAEKGLLGV